MTTAVLKAKLESVELPRINWKLVLVLGCFATLLLSFVYVWQIVSLTSGSYVFDKYESQIAKLSQENKNLQVNFAESTFLSDVLQKAQALNFKRITSVKYIQIPDNSFAIAK
jgi:hypothetical protein